MQPPTPTSLVAVGNLPASAMTPQLNAPISDQQLAALQQAWLEHQIHPLLEVQWRGVPDSPLHE